MSNHDSLFISKNVIKKIILIVVSENKNLNINKSSFMKILQKLLVINIKKDNHLSLLITLEIQDYEKIKNNVEQLQADIKEMIEHITNYHVDEIKVNLV